MFNNPFTSKKKRNFIAFLEVLSMIVETHEKESEICYDNDGDRMRNEILINNVIKELDNLIRDFEVYYTLKNMNENKKERKEKKK